LAELVFSSAKWVEVTGVEILHLPLIVPNGNDVVDLKGFDLNDDNSLIPANKENIRLIATLGSEVSVIETGSALPCSFQGLLDLLLDKALSLFARSPEHLADDEFLVCHSVLSR
jgi:hypothetical protein